VLTQAIKDQKILANRFATQILTLEDKVKHLENKVVDGLNEVRAQELCLDRTTQANDDYKKQNAQLTKKLESKSLGHVWNILSFLNHFLTDPARLAESNAELNALKVIVDNAVAFFYPGESSRACASQILDNMPIRSWEIILTNMSQSTSLTLRIMKSLYPRADLDAAGEGFTVTCSDE
jgi:hypothetical protein